MTRAQKFLYVKRFAGEPKSSDFQLISEELQPLEENGIFSSVQFSVIIKCIRFF